MEPSSSVVPKQWQEICNRHCFISQIYGGHCDADTKVELVGTVTEVINQSDSRVIYSIDDGTAVIMVIHFIRQRSEMLQQIQTLDFMSHPKTSGRSASLLRRLQGMVNQISQALPVGTTVQVIGRVSTYSNSSSSRSSGDAPRILANQVRILSNLSYEFIRMLEIAGSRRTLQC